MIKPVEPDPRQPEADDPDPWCTSPDPAPDPQEEVTSQVQADYHPDRWSGE